MECMVFKRVENSRMLEQYMYANGWTNVCELVG